MQVHYTFLDILAIREGWSIMQLGGGCIGLIKIMTDRTYFLLTDEVGVNKPDDITTILVGHYDMHGNPYSPQYVMAWDQVTELIKSYKYILFQNKVKI